MDKPIEKIGILGGTFDPIHIGHLLIARDAMEAAGLTRVKFVPCAQSPHKTTRPTASARDRLAMVRLAIRENARFEADDIEIRRRSASYSVETVEALQRREPDADFYFILGADSYRELHRWREIGRLAKLCRFLVLARPGFAPRNPRLHCLRARFIEAHVCSVSATEIRTRLGHQKSVRYLVPDAVNRYIERRGLYQNP